jgi:hypothetical protein
MTKTKSKHGLWYFAHPYSYIASSTGQQVAGVLDANFNLCNVRAANLIKWGYNVFAPISHSHPIQRAHPELMAMTGREEGQFWYALDNEFIENVNFKGIILAPRWERSTGCIAERKLFEQQGKSILLYNTLEAANGNII